MHSMRLVIARFSACPLLLALAISATAADNKKPAKAASKVAIQKGMQRTVSPAMTIERGSDAGGEKTVSQLPTMFDVNSAAVVTTEKLNNGLTMITSSEGFMTTLVVTRATDGQLVYKCDQDHPKGAHTHPRKPLTAGSEK